MAPLVAAMRSATAIDQEASTRNSTRLAAVARGLCAYRSPGLDGKSHLFALLGALVLERRGRPEGGVKGQVVGLFVGRAGLNIAAALAIGISVRAASRMVAHHLVERGIQAARLKNLAGFGFCATLPPGSVWSLKTSC